jgi:hypothetical protein
MTGAAAAERGQQTKPLHPFDTAIVRNDEPYTVITK